MNDYSLIGDINVKLAAAFFIFASHGLLSVSRGCIGLNKSSSVHRRERICSLQSISSLKVLAACVENRSDTPCLRHMD